MVKQTQDNFIDLFSLTLHQAVAEKLRKNEKHVLQIALENLKKWLNKNESAALIEWREILETRSAQEIIKIITADTDQGQRLRSSSPFAGVLSEAEREKIWSECAQIRSFELIDAIKFIAPDEKPIIVGSQAVHLVSDFPPDIVRRSVECDFLLIGEKSETRAEINKKLGVFSSFQIEHGFYADALGLATVILPTAGAKDSNR